MLISIGKNIGNNKGIKHYVLVTLTFLFVAANLLLLDQVIDIKQAFLLGIFTGMSAVWVVFTIVFFLARKRSVYTIDERTKFLVRTAAFYAFIIFYFIAAFFTILLKGTAIQLNISATDLCTWGFNSMFIIYMISYFILSRRH